MESQTVHLTTLICDALNSIFFKIFSSVDHTIYSSLDSILFIHSDILDDTKFQNLFGTDLTHGLLLIANSFILGIILFYVLRFSVSHLTYSKVDSPYQFIFKCIIFTACMNSSFWLCEQFINLISFLSDSICEIGHLLTGYEISFCNFIHHMNSILFPSLESFDIFSLDGILKFISSISLIFILFTFLVRSILCKIWILIAPFAFLSLSTHHFSGFFKGWLKQLLVLLSMQIVVSIALVLGFTLDFHTGNILSKLTFLAILFVIAKCSFYVKKLFLHIYYCHQNKLKDFI